ncbi:TetR family transcriptional regulator [Nocardioides phosphati]|uniref:TetR family transcriptional regulator n=1 Tax=Nocardioides phosphati TaxID=1867775 RepID=A0ABQ2NDK9_9ACTN|nr:TetR/AcrR family transcriptional regulator [Nocardioides phosphati]GGO93184.1 TetR family transcriptional regulator [Nocardioides phosphati]
MPPAVPSRIRDGRNTRWDEHREQRRRLILDAAIAVVSEAPPGAELRLHDVAERVGLVRTVVQRHFGGRLQLTRAVQADVLEQAFALITRPVDLTQTLYAVAHSLVGETVHWVVGNPSLHALVERELGDGEQSELNRATTRYAGFLEQIVAGVAVGRGMTLDASQAASTHLLFVGIAGHVRAAVAYWASEEAHTLDADALERLLTDTIVGMVIRHAATLGLELDPDAPLLGS